MFEKFDFTPGRVTQNDFPIEEDILLNEDNDELKEDMLQVVYPQNYTLDVGWYSGIKKFIVFVVKDYNWEEPIVKIICEDIEGVKKEVLKGISIIRKCID